MFRTDKWPNVRKGLPMILIRTSLVSFLLLAIAAAQLAADRDHTQQPSFLANVSPAKAQFLVPISHRDNWDWHRNDTKDNVREYCIEVAVRNDSEDYKFGFYLFKKPGSTPGRGDLIALLKAGQQSLFIRQPGGQFALVNDAGITVRPEKDSLIISIEGKQNVERLFSSRPQKVRF